MYASPLHGAGSSSWSARYSAQGGCAEPLASFLQSCPPLCGTVEQMSGLPRTLGYTGLNRYEWSECMQPSRRRARRREAATELLVDLLPITPHGLRPFPTSSTPSYTSQLPRLTSTQIYPPSPPSRSSRPFVDSDSPPLSLRLSSPSSRCYSGGRIYCPTTWEALPLKQSVSSPHRRSSRRATASPRRFPSRPCFVHPGSISQRSQTTKGKLRRF